jgi:sugar/nucleoside kinase (ribokinase family)
VCFGYLAHARILHVDTYPPADTGTQVTGISTSLAGDAPLTALTARRLGLTTHLLSNPTGPDPDGRHVLAALGAAGVTHHAAPTTTGDTPQVTVVVDTTGTRTWFAYLADTADHLTEVDPAPLTTARLAYLDCYRIIETAAIAAITTSRVPLLLNLGGDPPTVALTAAARQRHVAFAQTSLDGTNMERAEHLATTLREALGAEMAVVTLGAGGALARTATGTHRTTAATVPIRHTHGAGAVFSAGLAHAHLTAMAPGEALRAACTLATTHCTTRTP